MMKTQVEFLFMLFLLKHKVTYASMWPNQRYSELNMYLQGSTFESSKVNTIFACYRKCEENIHCASINMNLTNKTCELKHSTKTRNPKFKFSRTQNTVYMEIRDALGSTPHNPIPSCKGFKNLDNQVKSGVYWMKFNGPSSAPFQVFCDMTTDGGGWTLVYSYRIIQLNNYDSFANNISPIPNWPVTWSSSNWEPQSTTTPLSESSHSAMDFALWKKIGNEFLLTPNITNWVACEEGTGSLVNWVTGSLTCRVVKAITPTCTTIAPNTLDLWECGPVLKYNSGLQFILDGKTTFCFPTHDPCGDDSHTNHLNDLPNPGGAMYIR